MSPRKLLSIFKIIKIPVVSICFPFKAYLSICYLTGFISKQVLNILKKIKYIKRYIPKLFHLSSMNHLMINGSISNYGILPTEYHTKEINCTKSFKRNKPVSNYLHIQTMT